jgi:endonuclease/exonuclease/phosphatase family metal-dependent hydrolase
MRLLSYNIHKGIGGRDRRYDLSRVVSVISHAQPDLICLQEVAQGIPRTRLDDQADLLSRSFPGYSVAYQTNHVFRVGSYGNLVLTRWPIDRAHDVCLRYLHHKKRGAQLLVVQTPSGPLHLVNWHLSLAEKMRRWQANYLLEHHHFREASHLPTLITGDFNDWRNTLAGAAFARHGLEQVTQPLHRFLSFPAYLAMGALDKVFCCRQVHVHHAHVLKNRLARAASDHLPLIIDFDFKAEIVHASA